MWNVVTYSISYSLNGGTVSENPSSYTVETATFTLNNPTKTGYTFTGWTGSNGATAQTTVTISKGSTGNKEYTANWTANEYTISYNSGNYIYGLDTNVSNVTTTASIYSISNKSITLTASQNDGYCYTPGRVYLEANKTYIFSCTTDGTWGSSTSSDTVEAFLMLNGELNTYYSMSSNNNYAFTPLVSGTYWLRLDVNQSGKTYTFSSIQITEQITSETKTYGTTLGTLPTPSRVGHTFKGWYTAASGGTQVTSTTAVPAQNTTYYAQWTVNSYTLTVNPNGGTWNSKISNSTIAQNYGTTTNLGTATPPAAYTVTFNGNSGTAGTSELESTSSFSNWTLSGDGYLSENIYTFSKGNGTVTANYTNYSSITLPTATRPGYIFNGWYTAASGGSKIGNAGASYTPTSSITLYAQWTLAIAQIDSSLYPSLASAIEAVPATKVQTTITMLQNTSENVTVSSTKNVKLNTNGKTITGKSSTAATITNNGTLYVYGSGKIDQGSYTLYNNGGVLTIAEGTIGNAAQLYTVQNESGILNVSGGTITNSINYAVSGAAGTTINVTGGTIKTTAGGNSSALISKGTLNVSNNATIISNANGIALLGSTAVGTITNAKVTVTGTVTNSAIYATNKAKVNVYTSTITATNNYIASASEDDGTYDASIVLYNCTLTTNKKICAGGHHSIAVTTDSTGYYVTYFDGGGTIPLVLAPTWTSANGQDDIIWGNVSSTTLFNTRAFKYRVDKSAHNNESGTYYTELYKSQNGTNSKIGGITVSF